MHIISAKLCEYRFSQTNEYLKERKYSLMVRLFTFGINYFLRSIDNRCPNIINFGAEQD